MTDVNPVSLERHGNRAWNKTSNFGWARQEQVVTVALQEATHLMMALPLAFLKHEGQYQFLALLGLQPGENLWVHADGRWIAPHVPGIMVRPEADHPRRYRGNQKPVAEHRLRHAARQRRRLRRAARYRRP